MEPILEVKSIKKYFSGQKAVENISFSINKGSVFGLLGDGWHNNHHAHGLRYYSGEKWWEWDLMGTIIKFIKID